MLSRRAKTWQLLVKNEKRLRTLVSLEESLNTALAKEKEAKKKMNASNARALTAMKQKVRKTIKEHETDVKRFQNVSIGGLLC